MPALNLRDVPTELIQKLKSDAALAGMKLKPYCVAKLMGEVGVVAEERESMEVEADDLVAIEVMESLPKVKPDRVLTGFRREGNMIYERKVEMHNPETCRTYKCGMCAAVKEGR